jgi:hypothetical protein
MEMSEQLFFSEAKTIEVLRGQSVTEMKQWN